ASQTSSFDKYTFPRNWCPQAIHLYSWTPWRTPFFFVMGEWQHGHFFCSCYSVFRDFETTAKVVIIGEVGKS
ncbi:MAG: hypothetical protein J5552_02120, partial [Prevotella sp.]|nr:hypothetical protein [Prevotella sp.]